MKIQYCPQQLQNPFRFCTTLLLICVVLFSCQKKYLGPADVSYGTLFEHLQKMVVTNGSGVTTHTFSYDANYNVATHTTLFKAKGSSNTNSSVAQYYRGGTTVDSIKITVSVNGSVTAVKKIYLYYAGNNIEHSVMLSNINDPACTRDSSVYDYTGNFLIERMDYVTSGSAPYSSTYSRDLVFQYSGTNISNLIFIHTPAGTSSPVTTLVSYNYDTSKPALPINGFQYGYDSVGFVNHAYAAVNNLSSVKYGEGSSQEGANYLYEYHSIARKPIKATLKETNATGDMIESKIEFFYD